MRYNGLSECSPQRAFVLPGLFSIGFRGEVVRVTIIITRRPVTEKARAPTGPMDLTPVTLVVMATMMALRLREKVKRVPVSVLPFQVLFVAALAREDFRGLICE